MIFVPDLMINNITELDEKTLNKMGIKGLLIDADKTLAFYGKNEPLEGVAEWLSLMKHLDIKIVIISNNYKKRVKPLAGNLGIENFVANSFKPTPIGIIRAMKKIKVKKSKIAMVGDQIYTDVLGANLFGITSIYVKPKIELVTRHDKFVAFVEKIPIKRYYKKHGGK